LKAAQGENKLMKLMKHITIALVLCAIPAMAFAQTAGCTDCDHTVSYYKGTGGLIATAAEDAEKVGFVASCGGTTRTGELTPNDDGVVSMLLTGDYACNADKGSFDIGPITDGGWYWINDEDNSAIGNLVAKDTLDNTAVELTGAGDGVTMSAGSGAVFVKETATGRVGILPNILADPPPTPPTPCGYRAGAAPGTFNRVNSGCMLGDGGTMVRIVTPNPYGAASHTVGTGQIIRPYTGTTTFTVDLWGNGTGHYTSDATADARLGNAASPAANPPLDATFDATIGAAAGPGGTTAIADAGVAIASAGGVGTITVSALESYCGTVAKPTSFTATINIVSTVANPAQVVPDVADTSRTAPDTQGAGAMVTAVCPGGSAANMGAELVPDNPFPVSQ
jgi:hypothetical protein